MHTKHEQVNKVDLGTDDDPWEPFIPWHKKDWHNREEAYILKRLKTPYSQREAAEKIQDFIQKHNLTAMTSLLNTGTLRLEFSFPDFTCWLNKNAEFWIKEEDAQDNPEFAKALYKLLSEEPTNTEEEEQTMSEKNAAAFLRNDTKTVGVRLLTDNSPTKEYTYVTTLNLAVDDLVIVPCVSDQNFNLAKVTRVDEKLCIEPRSGTKYKWVAAKADLTDYQATLEANKQIEEMLADSYRKQAQIAYKEQLLQLAGDNQQLRALIGSGS